VPARRAVASAGKGRHGGLPLQCGDLALAVLCSAFVARMRRPVRTAPSSACGGGLGERRLKCKSVFTAAPIPTFPRKRGKGLFGCRGNNGEDNGVFVAAAPFVAMPLKEEMWKQAGYIFGSDNPCSASLLCSGLAIHALQSGPLLTRVVIVMFINEVVQKRQALLRRYERNIDPGGVWERRELFSAGLLSTPRTQRDAGHAAPVRLRAIAQGRRTAPER
jgi:hypothetical protein